jgi:hypothetical protein
MKQTETKRISHQLACPRCVSYAAGKVEDEERKEHVQQGGQQVEDGVQHEADVVSVRGNTQCGERQKSTVGNWE